jgi:hypothetical protein
MTLVLFTGIFLTGFGSSYYHWNPNDGTLFWDRLPMTLCFAAILAAVVEERVDARAGALLLRPLLAIGIFSLLLWRWTDDLRLYAWAQFFPFVALVLILNLYPPKFTGASCWIVAAALYALAKLLEFLDHAVYSVGTIVSGHTLKHLAAAAAAFTVLRLFQIRRPIDDLAKSGMASSLRGARAVRSVVYQQLSRPPTCDRHRPPLGNEGLSHAMHRLACFVVSKRENLGSFRER